MPILSFVVPTNSRARVYVSADLLIHAPDVDATWRDLTDGRTILLVVCDDDRAETLTRLITKAHRKVEQTTPAARDESPARSGTRRTVARHRA